MRTGDRSHPAEQYLNQGDHLHALVPAQGGMHPFSMLVIGVAALAGIVLTVDLPWVQVSLISTTVFATAAVLTMSRYRLLALTDADIVVMRTRALRPAKPVELLEPHRTGRAVRCPRLGVGADRRRQRKAVGAPPLPQPP